MDSGNSSVFCRQPPQEVAEKKRRMARSVFRWLLCHPRLPLLLCLCVVAWMLLYCHSASSVLHKGKAAVVRVMNPRHNMAANEPQSGPAWIAQRKWATAHYVWCGERVFRFENFLSLMSLVTTFDPLKVVFHYDKMPKQTEYHAWFNISKDRIPIMEMIQLPGGSCNGNMTAGPKVVASVLAKGGGVWAGDATLLTPSLLELQKPEVSQSGPWQKILGKERDGQGVVMVTPFILSSQTEETKSRERLEKLLKEKADFACLPASKPMDFWDRTVDGKYTHTDEGDLPPCLAFDGVSVSSADRDHVLHPRDIWTLDSALGRAARLALYGTQEPQWPAQNSQQLAPLISHQIWLDDPDFKFEHFLAMQSALHVAKFERVYFHANVVPKGKYWEALMRRDGHRITMVPLEPSNRIFGNPVWEVRHRSDVLRPVVLSKYGGVYQDRDVVYTSPIPQALLAFECVKSFDWPRYDEFPEAISPGFIIAKPGARWLKTWTDSMKDYREGDVTYNSIRLPYRKYELNPTLLFTERHLQVVCYFAECHPPWVRSYQQGYLHPSDKKWRWQDAISIHVTHPKPPKEWESPKSLLAARAHVNDTMYAAVGWNVVEKADLEDLLRELQD